MENKTKMTIVYADYDRLPWSTRRWSIAHIEFSTKEELDVEARKYEGRIVTWLEGHKTYEELGG